MSVEYMNCPYCNKEIEIEFSDYESGTLQLFECEKCEKVFHWHWESSIGIYTDKIEGLK